jgi:hypothetical protein
VAAFGNNNNFQSNSQAEKGIIDQNRGKASGNAKE